MLQEHLSPADPAYFCCIHCQADSRNRLLSLSSVLTQKLLLQSFSVKWKTNWIVWQFGIESVVTYWYVLSMEIDQFMTPEEG